MIYLLYFFFVTRYRDWRDDRNGNHQCPRCGEASAARHALCADCYDETGSDDSLRLVRDEGGSVLYCE